jgi:hypothetical protein
MSARAECLQGDFTSALHVEAATTTRRRDWTGIGWVSLGTTYVLGMIGTFFVALG